MLANALSVPKRILEEARRVMREVEACPYRENVRPAQDAEWARCGLIERITGDANNDAARVRKDACGECCRAAEPSPEMLNPMVASLLYMAARNLVMRGG